jgi:hypothetical protein
MQRYYFHLKRGQVIILDHVGVELADDAAAVEEAAKRGREIATREALSGQVPSGGVIIIDDEWQRVIEIHFWFAPVNPAPADQN